MDSPEAKVRVSLICGEGLVVLGALLLDGAPPWLLAALVVALGVGLIRPDWVLHLAGTVKTLRLRSPLYQSYQDAEAELTQAPLALYESGARLETRFSQESPYFIDEVSSRTYRFGVYNHGPEPARNIRVQLVRIEPSISAFSAHFPHPAPRWVGGATQMGGRYTINPRDEELFLIAGCRLKDDFSLVLTGYDSRGTVSYEPRFPRDDEWTFSYRITAENADPIDQEFIVSNEFSFVTVRHAGEPNPTVPNWRDLPPFRP